MLERSRCEGKRPWRLDIGKAAGCGDRRAQLIKLAAAGLAAGEMIF
jgi:hypothetical protein